MEGEEGRREEARRTVGEKESGREGEWKGRRVEGKKLGGGREDGGREGEWKMGVTRVKEERAKGGMIIFYLVFQGLRGWSFLGTRTHTRWRNSSWWEGASW